MAQMHTLILNGQAYTLVDSAAARIDDDVVGETTWSSKTIIDRLCPGFFLDAPVTVCRPVAGYPLQVAVDPGLEEAVSLTHCGKNMIDPERFLAASQKTTLEGDVFTTDFTGASVHVNMLTRTPVVYPAGHYTLTILPVSETVSMDIFCYAVTGGAILARSKVYNSSQVHTFSFSCAEPFVLSLAGCYYEAPVTGMFSYRLQLEQGDTASAYEMYKGKTVTAQPGQTLEMPALEGVNTLWNTGGNTKVTGKADLAALLV